MYIRTYTRTYIRTYKLTVTYMYVPVTNRNAGSIVVHNRKKLDAIKCLSCVIQR